MTCCVCVLYALYGSPKDKIVLRDALEMELVEARAAEDYDRIDAIQRKVLTLV